MKIIGIALIALPLVLFIAAGLIFDTADFLTAMAVLAAIAAPVALGAFLYLKADS